MNEASAQSFAEILWTSFGPKTDTNAPRPFGDAVVDGFDFDIESVLKPGEDKEDLSRGYSSLINGLRAYYLSSNGSYYISGAPQCIVPDAHLADAIETAFFDFLFVQFYNTAECSARAYFDHSYGGKNTNISFSGWVDFVHTHGLNKETKVYLGLPASNDANDVVDPKMYLQPKEAKEMIQAFQCEYPEDFGGVMLYEATASETHPINGVPYADVLKKDLNQGCNPNPPVANSTSNASSTKASSSASSTKASSTAATFPTMVPSSLPFGLAPPSSSGAPYPISSGSAPSSGPTGSSGVVVRSGSVSSKSGTAPYSFKTGTAPYSTKTGTAPYTVKSGTSAPSSGPTGSSGVVVPSGSMSSKSGTAPYSFKTGTAPYSTETGTTPYTMKSGTSASASATVVPSGASSGYLPSGSGSGSSSIPYPVSNSSSAISTGGYSSSTTTSGEEVVTLTDVVTLTSCGPEVTNCPARSHPVVSTETHISTIHSGSSASVSAGSSSYAASTPGNRPQSSEEVATSSSVPAGGASGPSSASSVPGNSPQTTQEVVTTDIVTSYVTTCPVTSTATSGGSQIIETGSTVSTVYSTIISTICTKCVAPPTSAPTQKASPSAPVSESQSPFTGTVTPSASIQEVVTTMM